MKMKSKIKNRNVILDINYLLFGCVIIFKCIKI